MATTKYYTPSGEPVDLSRARAVTLRAEFISIQQAFIGVEVDTKRALTFPEGEVQEITAAPADRAGGVLALDNTTGDAIVIGGAADTARKGQILGWDASTGELTYWDYASTITSPVNAAAQSEANAAQSATAAAQSATAAAQSADSALASEQKAHKWSDSPYGTEVESGKFSAFHWSEQAHKWSDSPYGVEVETGKFSAFHWSERAHKWAETDEDVEVSTGEYSAKHWARKAARYVANSAIDDTTVSDITTFSSNKITYEIRAYKLPKPATSVPPFVNVNTVVPNELTFTSAMTSVVLPGVELTVVEPAQISDVLLDAHVFGSDVTLQGDVVAFSPIYVLSSVEIPSGNTFQVLGWALVI